MATPYVRRILAALLFAMLLPVSGAAFGQVLFDDERSVDNRGGYQRHQVTLDAETRIKLTYAAEKTGNGSHLRIRIYRRVENDDADYRILDRPVHIRNESASDELYATLPAGHYRFDVDTKRMDIHVTLEVAADEDGGD